jgi:two-component sensor histidine kinase
MKNISTNTLFVQALLVILLPVILFTGIFYFIKHAQQRDILINQKEKEQSALITRIKKTLMIMDKARLMSEKLTENQLKTASYQLMQNYPRLLPELVKGDITKLLTSQQIDANEFELDFIDSTLTVINSNNPKEFGYHLGQPGDRFERFFKHFIKTDSFFVDRAGYSEIDGSSKQYAYHACGDGKYILELALTPKNTTELTTNFNNYISHLDTTNEFITGLNVFYATRDIKSIVAKKILPIQLKTAFLNVLQTHTDFTKDTLIDQKRHTDNLVFLPMEGAKTIDGYIVYYTSNNQSILELKSKLFYEFLITLLIICSVLCAIIILGIKRITAPIYKLINEFEKIENGDYHSTVQLELKNELGLLGKHYNRAVKSIRELRDTLELKIVKRTQELNEKNHQLRKEKDAKTLLIQETHHRVKNNLQILSSIISLQLSHHKNQDLEDLNRRIIAISSIHQQMYQDGKNSTLNLANYIRELSRDVLHVSNHAKAIDLHFQLGELIIKTKLALPIGLIINELITNSVKHAFKDIENSAITIHLSLVEKNTIKLTYADNGIGFQESQMREESFGLSLVTIFTEQLNGSVTKQNVSVGTSYVFIFDLES